jgi:hypothetical protein
MLFTEENAPHEMGFFATMRACEMEIATVLVIPYML